jgi:hypothetical protein
MGNTTSAQVIWRNNMKKERGKYAKGKGGKGSNRGKIEG